MAGRVVIAYCPACGWLLRAGWYAQELLQTFAAELDEVALRPAAQGEFHIEADGRRIWERRTDGGFPDIAELKRRVRDVICPDRELGHLDRRRPPPQS